MTAETRRMGRPRAITSTYRIIAGDYNGWLQGDEFFTPDDWYRQERLRRRWRRNADRKRVRRQAQQ